MLINEGDRFIIHFKGIDVKMSSMKRDLIKATGKKTWGELDGSVVVSCQTVNAKDHDPFNTYFEAWPDFEGERITFLSCLNDNFTYLEPIAKNTVKQVTCLCSITTGCSCGAFQVEMLLSGKVYDKWLRTWVKKGS
jgi:hypothetical protein